MPLAIGLSAVDLAIATAVALAAYLVMSIALRLASTAANGVANLGQLRGAGSAAAFVREVLGGTSQWLMVLTALLIGVQTLHPVEPWSARLSHLWFLTMLLQAALWANRAITLGLTQYVNRHAGQGARAGAASTLLSWALRTLLWTVAVLAILSNIGVNITAFVASLGIGGVAVALAVQNILGDLFASLSIAVDKPFEVGDAIGVGAFSGTVEYVGLKTTRIRAVGGEQLIMSNAELLKQTVSNYRRQATRRVVFRFGVAHDTSPEQAEAIPGILRSIIESSDKLRFDRAHLKEIGADALNYEVVYIVLNADYNDYMDLQQMINLHLMRELEGMGARFAFPTRSTPVDGQMPSPTTERMAGGTSGPAHSGSRAPRPETSPAQT